MAINENNWGAGHLTINDLLQWRQQNHQHRHLAALLHTSHGNLHRWHKEHPIRARNKTTRFLSRLNRIHDIMTIDVEAK